MGHQGGIRDRRAAGYEKRKGMGEYGTPGLGVCLIRGRKRITAPKASCERANVSRLKKGLIEQAQEGGQA